MKIEARHDKEGAYLAIKEAYCNVVLETTEGNQVAICMRDDTIEFNVIKFKKWHRINMDNGNVSLIHTEIEIELAHDIEIERIESEMKKLADDLDKLKRGRSCT